MNSKGQLLRNPWKEVRQLPLPVRPGWWLNHTREQLLPLYQSGQDGGSITRGSSYYPFTSPARMVAQSHEGAATTPLPVRPGWWLNHTREQLLPLYQSGQDGGSITRGSSYYPFTSPARMVAQSHEGAATTPLPVRPGWWLNHMREQLLQFKCDVKNNK